MVTVLLSGEDYLSTNEPSRFSREFKLEALRRMEAGENVSDLARQLGVSRKSIYQWRNRYRLGGSKALRGRGNGTDRKRYCLSRRQVAQKRRLRLLPILFIAFGSGARQISTLHGKSFNRTT